MGVSRGRKIKTLAAAGDSQVFWMSLEEAKQMIADKYEFLADRYERQPAKNKPA